MKIKSNSRITLNQLIAILFIMGALFGCKSASETEEVLSPTVDITATSIKPEPTTMITKTPVIDQAPTAEIPETPESMDYYNQVDPKGQSVNFWHTLTDEQETTLLDIVAEFNSTNTWGIIVEPSFQGGIDEIKGKMLSVLNTSDSPNLLISTESQAASYQLEDALINIDHFINDKDWGLTQTDIQDFLPGVLDRGINPLFNDNRLSFPLFGEMDVLFYNLDWLFELGYTTPPTNPESLLEAACKATSKSFSGATTFGRWGIHLNISSNSFSDWSLAFGGRPFDYGANQYNFDNVDTIDAMTSIQTIMKRGCGIIDANLSVNSPFNDAQSGFSKGVLLFVIESTSMIPDFRNSIQEEANFNWQISALPHRTIQPATNLQLTSTSIPKTTPQQELASWIFLKFFTSPEIQAKWIRETNTLPLKGKSINLLNDYYSRNQAAQMTLALINDTSMEPIVPGYDQVRELANESLQKILNGSDVTTELTELSKEANQLLEEQIALFPELMDPWADIDPSEQSIIFWHQQDPERSAILEEIINEFNANNKWGINVVPVVHQSYGEIFEKLLPVLGTADAPSLVLAYQHHAAAYYEAGGLVNLDTFLQSATWGLSSEVGKDFFQPIIKQDQFAFFEGVRLGFPFQRSTDLLYYNADLLTELGYQEPPTNPEEFKEMACAASTYLSSSNRDGIGYQFYLDATRFSSWVFAFGGDVYDEDQNRFLLNEAGATSTITFLRDLIASGCAETATERITSQTSFSQGSLLFMIDSSFHLSSVGDLIEDGADFNWSVAPIPTVAEKPVQNVFGASLSLPVSSPEEELAAWLFIKYLTEPQVQARWGEEAGYLPARISSEDLLTDFFETSPNYQVAFDLLPFGKTEPSLPGYDFIHQEMELALQSIFLQENEDPEEDQDEINIDQILDSLNSTINQILLIHIER